MATGVINYDNETTPSSQAFRLSTDAVTGIPVADWKRPLQGWQVH